MRRTSRLFASLTFAALMSGSALAADLGNIINAPQEDPYVPVEIGTGWYIRGDISYDFSSSKAASYRTYGVASAGPPVTYAYGSDTYDRFTNKSGSDFDVGVGYQFNSYLRGDATLGYWHTQVTGRDTTAILVPGTACAVFDPLAASCRSEDNTTVKALESMANVYADLGTFVGVTPYIGAGAGVSHVTYGTLTNQTFCVDGAGADLGKCGAAVTHGGLNSWRFTYALMAGASYDLSKNLKFDLGYRYSHTSSGAMFGFDAASKAAGATGTMGSDKGFSTHQIRAGVRYAIW